MRRLAILGCTCLVTLAAAPSSARRSHELVTKSIPAARKEIIAVYVGTSGTNNGERYQSIIRRMRASLKAEAGKSQHDVVLRGVSLDPLIDDGLKDLATL